MNRCCGMLVRRPRWRAVLSEGPAAIARYASANPRDIRDIAITLLKDIKRGRNSEALAMIIQACDAQLASVTMIQDVVIAAVQTLNNYNMHIQAAEIVRYKILDVLN
jgi:hypothetical protein